METEQPLSEQQSIQLITEMIQKVKHDYHESGTSAILWGSVVGLAGLISFAERFWKFYIGFDIWLVVLAAIIPQTYISIKESRERKIVTHTEAAVDAIWLVFGISIFALVFYFNVVPAVTEKMISKEGISLLQTNGDGSTKALRYFIPSQGSLLLILYAIPTMATGIAHRFWIMLWASIVCFVFFIVSCYTIDAYDMLLNGFAGIINWLIPGLILRKYYRYQQAINVQRS